MSYQIHDDEHVPLDAHYDLEEDTIVYHSRGGSKGSANALNTDYSIGLKLLLTRVSKSQVSITDAWVDSSRTQALPIEDRRIISVEDLSKEPDFIFRTMSARMKKVGRDPGALPTGGNATKRISIQLSDTLTPTELNKILGGRKTSKDFRSRDRLPASELAKVGDDHVWNAVQRLLDGYSDHGFAPSTDYDMIVDEGHRMDPKAVFGVAASDALGFKVLPKHFSGGIGTPCFAALTHAGYNIVLKTEDITTDTLPISPEDKEWSEGKPKRVSHLVRERHSGLSKAKKADFEREHGKLFCEKCKMDPIATYGEKHGSACIEVHHHATKVRDMSKDHKTRLADLHCLCANCHRIAHRQMR